MQAVSLHLVAAASHRRRLLLSSVSISIHSPHSRLSIVFQPAAKHFPADPPLPSFFLQRLHQHLEILVLFGCFFKSGSAEFQFRSLAKADLDKFCSDGGGCKDRSPIYNRGNSEPPIKNNAVCLCENAKMRSEKINEEVAEAPR